MDQANETRKKEVNIESAGNTFKYIKPESHLFWIGICGLLFTKSNNNE